MFTLKNYDTSNTKNKLLSGTVVVIALALEVIAFLFVAGVVQMVFGVLRLGKLIRLVPQLAIFGFVNGYYRYRYESQALQDERPYCTHELDDPTYKVARDY